MRKLCKLQFFSLLRNKFKNKVSIECQNKRLRKLLTASVVKNWDLFYPCYLHETISIIRISFDRFTPEVLWPIESTNLARDNHAISIWREIQEPGYLTSGYSLFTWRLVGWCTMDDVGCYWVHGTREALPRRKRKPMLIKGGAKKRLVFSRSETLCHIHFSLLTYKSHNKRFLK